SAIISSSDTTSSVNPNSSACFLRFSYRTIVSDSASYTAFSNPLTSSGCGTSADFVVGTPPRDFIFDDKYMACPNSSVISSSKNGFNDERYNPDTTDALYVY